MDDSDNSPGWKFAEYEMKGVPLRAEIGPRDIENGQCVLARRDTGEKVPAALDGIGETVLRLLGDIHDNLYAMALKNREENTFDIHSPEEAKAIAEGKGGFLRSKWCGSLECELRHEGAGRRLLPLHAPQAVRHRGRVPRVRKEVHHGHPLGRGVLREKNRGFPN
jgi:prolyl-tRNA synthetase